MVYEELDLILGDHAPFLISLSDGLSEELRLVIATAEVGETGEKVPAFEDTDEATKQALQGILAKTKPIEINNRCQYEICFQDYILYQIRNESYCSFDPEEIHHGWYLFLPYGGVQWKGTTY